jgi:CheY-like chemotaxis protein
VKITPFLPGNKTLDCRKKNSDIISKDIYMNNNSEKQKILVVDDDEVQLTLAEAILKDTYTTTTAKSGKKALEHLYKGFIPSIILLDILMPEMDGFETYNRIRAISLLRDIPIVFMTSLQGTNEMQQAMEAGATDFIRKPYNSKELLQRIKGILPQS